MRRVIFDYELIYLESGSFTFIYNDIPYHLSAGDIIFICPGVPHSFQIDSGDISQPHIHFDITHRVQSEKIPISFKDIGKMNEQEKSLIHKNYFPLASSPLPLICKREEFIACFYSVIHEKNAITQKALMTQLISFLISDNCPDILKNSPPAKAISQIKDYIDAGNGFAMTLDDFASTFFYNKFYLERSFKKLYGASLIEYRNKKRMEFANCFLDENSVSKVAEMLGFNSIYSFSRAYKNYYGYSPSSKKASY